MNTEVEPLKIVADDKVEREEKHIDLDYDSDSFGGGDEVGSLEELVDHDPLVVHSLENVYIIDLDGWTITSKHLLR
jgi:hypothetical protein